jgi:tetratricopeptide (TPR) repeat protein
LRNIGSSFRRMGRLEEARDMYQQSLRIARINDDGCSASKSDLAHSLHSLGTIFNELRMFEEAFSVFEEVLAIMRQLHGENHPSVADTFVSMGTALAGQGKCDQEIRMLKKALKINRRIFGEDNLHVASVLQAMGSSYFDEGEFQKALGTFAKVIAMRDRALGVDNLENADAYVKMSGCQIQEPFDSGSAPESLNVALPAALESAKAGVRIYEMHGINDEDSEEAGEIVKVLMKANDILQSQGPSLAATFVEDSGLLGGSPMGAGCPVQ